MIFPDWIWNSPCVIAAFYPIHVYLNTDVHERYVSMRNLGSITKLTPGDLQPFVNREHPGIRDCLIYMLDLVARAEWLPLTVADFIRSNPPVDFCLPPGQGRLSTQYTPSRFNI